MTVRGEILSDDIPELFITISEKSVNMINYVMKFSRVRFVIPEYVPAY